MLRNVGALLVSLGEPNDREQARHEIESISKLGIDRVRIGIQHILGKIPPLPCHQEHEVSRRVAEYTSLQSMMPVM